MYTVGFKIMLIRIYLWPVLSLLSRMLRKGRNGFAKKLTAFIQVAGDFIFSVFCRKNDGQVSIVLTEVFQHGKAYLRSL